MQRRHATRIGTVLLLATTALSWWSVTPATRNMGNQSQNPPSGYDAYTTTNIELPLQGQNSLEVTESTTHPPRQNRSTFTYLNIEDGRSQQYNGQLDQCDLQLLCILPSLTGATGPTLCSNFTSDETSRILLQPGLAHQTVEEEGSCKHKGDEMMDAITAYDALSPEDHTSFARGQQPLPCARLGLLIGKGARREQLFTLTKVQHTKHNLTDSPTLNHKETMLANQVPNTVQSKQTCIAPCLRLELDERTQPYPHDLLQKRTTNFRQEAATIPTHLSTALTNPTINHAPMHAQVTSYSAISSNGLPAWTNVARLNVRLEGIRRDPTSPAWQDEHSAAISVKKLLESVEEVNTATVFRKDCRVYPSGKGEFSFSVEVSPPAALPSIILSMYEAGTQKYPSEICTTHSLTCLLTPILHQQCHKIPHQLQCDHSATQTPQCERLIPPQICTANNAVPETHNFLTPHQAIPWGEQQTPAAQDFSWQVQYTDPLIPSGPLTYVPIYLTKGTQSPSTGALSMRLPGPGLSDAEIKTRTVTAQVMLNLPGKTWEVASEEQARQHLEQFLFEGVQATTSPDWTRETPPLHPGLRLFEYLTLWRFRGRDIILTLCDEAAPSILRDMKGAQLSEHTRQTYQHTIHASKFLQTIRKKNQDTYTPLRSSSDDPTKWNIALQESTTQSLIQEIKCAMTCLYRSPTCQIHAVVQLEITDGSILQLIFAHPDPDLGLERALHYDYDPAQAKISGLQRSTVALTFAIYLEAKAAHAIGFGKAGLPLCLWLYSWDPTTGDLKTYDLGGPLWTPHNTLRHTQHPQTTLHLHYAQVVTSQTYNQTSKQVQKQKGPTNSLGH
jgi:hypothetical protein